MARRKKKADKTIDVDATLADRPAIDGRRPIRKLRHWKQQFDKDALFVWRRDVHWDNDTDFEMGEPVPEGLINPTKLRRFWESGWIELLDFSEPTNILTGEIDEPEDDLPIPDEDSLAARFAAEPVESPESDDSEEGGDDTPEPDSTDESASDEASDAPATSE